MTCLLKIPTWKIIEELEGRKDVEIIDLAKMTSDDLSRLVRSGGKLIHFISMRK